MVLGVGLLATVGLGMLVALSVGAGYAGWHDGVVRMLLAISLFEFAVVCLVSLAILRTSTWR